MTHSVIVPGVGGSEHQHWQSWLQRQLVSSSRVEQKKFMPDKFILVSPYTANTFKDIGVPFDIIEYPIDKKKQNKYQSQLILGLDPEFKHIINIGLFTRGKNQGYAFEIARLLQDYKIKFHFLGNQASNFTDYWEPIMETKPDNCVVWGEREDVDAFVQASDVHLFTSNMELNPLSIKESLGFMKPTMIFDLHTYMNKYDGFENIIYLTGDKHKDANQLLQILGLSQLKEKKLKQNLFTTKDIESDDLKAFSNSLNNLKNQNSDVKFVVVDKKTLGVKIN